MNPMTLALKHEPGGLAPGRKPSTGGSILRDCSETGICTLTFDRPNSSANVFDEATLKELNRHIEAIEKNSAIRGLVIRSAKDRIFIAGADIKSILFNTDPFEIGRTIAVGQSVFERLARLRIPTVAAIHGACVGGGYEVALACDWRVASPDRATKIGLPETKLGILPAWGGSTRLPRLIGLPKALDVILGGKTLPSKRALGKGMVDALAARENLEKMALQMLKRGKRPRPSFPLLNNGMSAAVLRRVVGSKLAKKTRGNYPAVEKALAVATKGISVTLEEALSLERTAIAELIASDSTRNLIRTFFLQERSKKIDYGLPESASPAPVRQAAVIAAGVMGAGIAQWLSSRGLSVTLSDIGPDPVAAGLKRAATLYRGGAKRGLFSAADATRGMDRIRPAAERVPLSNHDLVIEAAVEEMEIKRRIFADLDARCGEDTILATNTSALSIREIASATSRPDKVVGIHFFNPVHRMQLVEIVRGDKTSDDTLRRTLEFVRGIGKLPVVVRDRPGFLVNRILMPYLIEAGRLVDGGASVMLVDEAMRDFGMPMGPLRLIDEVGLDVALHVVETLHGEFGDRLKPPMILQQLLDREMTGRKSGRGFYRYRNDGKAVPSRWIAELAAPRNVDLASEAIVIRMAALMIDEAARCLEEEVVREPEDVDFAMIMGTGFAPFRGGPLRFADKVGAGVIVAALEDAGATPTTLLNEFAAHGGTFYTNSNSPRPDKLPTPWKR